MSTPTNRKLKPMSDQRGASLVIALVFVSVFGLLIGALLQFNDTNSRASGGYRSQRSINYATDAALEAAVTRTDVSVGRDPDLDPTNVCNPTENKTLVKMPATDGAPSMVVSCETPKGSGSGAPNDLGSPLPYSILTLGDRRTDGSTKSLGVRNTEPAPYNGNVSIWSLFQGTGDPCGSPSQETGMMFNKKVYPWVTTLFGFPIDSGCAPTQYQFAWNVTGDVFSNSKITIDEPNAVPHEVAVNGQPAGFIQARGGCAGSGASNVQCTDAGWSFSDGKGKDPGLEPGGDAETEYGPRSIADLPQVTPGTVSERNSWVAARKADCQSTKGLVTFEPGIYTSAKDLNNIFDSSVCQNAAFWFKPGADHFDFRDAAGDVSTENCSVNDGNWAFDSALQANNVHQWCVGGANASGYQQIIAGTPFNWDPSATVDAATQVLTLKPAAKSGDGPGTFFGLIPQRTQFDLGVGGTAANAIDGITANYAMNSSRSGSSIWLSGYPKVPRGNYTEGMDLRIAQAIVNPDRMNTPSVQVDYQTTGFLGLKTTGTCGPYALTEPAVGDTAIKTFLLSEVNAAAVDLNNPNSLSRCLNTGEKINTAVVRYNATRPAFQGSPYGTARLDGIEILAKSKTRPNFPRVPGVQPDGTYDPGGNCDPTAPGVQFIFGGDSHVYVPNGGFEICAGPNPVNNTTGKQIGVYGTPALPRLVPTTVDSTSGVTHRANAKSIAEGDGPFVAAQPYNSQTTLHFDGYPVPSGMSFTGTDTAFLRVSYDPKAGTPSLSVPGCGVLPAQPGGGGSGLRSVTVNVTACIGSGSRLTNGFDLVWDSGTGPACTLSSGTVASGDCPQLDGVEAIITLTPSNPNQTLRPAMGCATASPNYWWGVGSPDCALLRVDGPVDQSGSFAGGLIPGSQRQRRGRISVKGAIYAPSHALDIDDEDLTYPIASRGLVTRHLRMRGFKYADPSWQESVFNNYVDSRPSSRQVAFVVCAKSSGPCPSVIPNPDYNSTLPESPTNRKTIANPDVIGRAGVSFQAQTNKPAVAVWSVGKL